MDLIERQAAIDALAELQGRAYTKAELKGISKAWKRIKQLPSAQPYTDAEIQKMQELEQAEMQKAYECGRASAQPERKTGKWIIPYETTKMVSICSECGTHGRGNFCPNCGADMRGEQDEID